MWILINQIIILNAVLCSFYNLSQLLNLTFSLSSPRSAKKNPNSDVKKYRKQNAKRYFIQNCSKTRLQRSRLKRIKVSLGHNFSRLKKITVIMNGFCWVLVITEFFGWYVDSKHSTEHFYSKNQFSLKVGCQMNVKLWENNNRLYKPSQSLLQQLDTT